MHSLVVPCNRPCHSFRKVLPYTILERKKDVEPRHYRDRPGTRGAPSEQALRSRRAETSDQRGRGSRTQRRATSVPRVQQPKPFRLASSYRMKAKGKGMLPPTYKCNYYLLALATSTMAGLASVNLLYLTWPLFCLQACPQQAQLPTLRHSPPRQSQLRPRHPHPCSTPRHLRRLASHKQKHWVNPYLLLQAVSNLLPPFYYPSHRLLYQASLWQKSNRCNLSK